jgi:hypothetical protein
MHLLLQVANQQLLLLLLLLLSSASPATLPLTTRMRLVLSLNALVLSTGRPSRLLISSDLPAAAAAAGNTHGQSVTWVNF